MSVHPRVQSHTFTHARDPVVYVRVRWVLETRKHPACTVGWVARLCRSCFSPGKASRVSHARTPIGTTVVKSFRKNRKAQSLHFGVVSSSPIYKPHTGNSLLTVKLTVASSPERSLGHGCSPWCQGTLRLGVGVEVQCHIVDNYLRYQTSRIVCSDFGTAGMSPIPH